MYCNGLLRKQDISEWSLVRPHESEILSMKISVYNVHTIHILLLNAYNMTTFNATQKHYFFIPACTSTYDKHSIWTMAFRSTGLGKQVFLSFNQCK